MTEEPTFDRDGYPTDETLERIRTWPVGTFADMYAAMDYAGRAWSYPDRWRRSDEVSDLGRPEVVYTFSTGGWSGNESIVSAIEGNLMLRAIGAWSWRRGGHYVYRFPTEPQLPSWARPTAAVGVGGGDEPHDC